MNEYKLTFTVTINAEDDPSARQQARAIAEEVTKAAENADVSLKQIYPNKPPRGIQIS